ncbi:MAG TPA: 2-oxoglutarate dehydrogenase complex dihydrolipoyllysine-residue succinyltransferase [Devosiaceae bacterium]|jgi:2-oxoglutarate dehydrogenase E2 component (dihydrolipoamide succinyltransferase)|nr:2-oxoglutarate dehydrogenase complex dihydrolipoyllysine-residue succinyltransferase [Devosiaceae bacterium]
MAVEIRVPTLGESVTEATIGQWFKQVGDTIAADEPVVELETDKVTIEVPAPSGGVLESIAAKQGETVNVGALIGAIGEGSGEPAAASSKTEAKAEASRPETVADPVPAERPDARSKDEGETEAPPPGPAARKLMEEGGVSEGEIEGSGKRGQVLKEDVLAATARGGAMPSAMSGSAAAPVPEQKPAAKPAQTEAKPAEARVAEAPKPARGPVAAGDEAREERVKMTRLRQTIARRLKDAQNTAAMLTTFNEVDMAPIMALRSQYKELFEKKHGVKLGFMGFFTKAVVHALKEIPSVNAEIDGDELVFKNYAHIGVAVGTDKGLVVPVVRDADQLSIADIEKEINRLGKAARDGALSMADMQGGTFTISNGGVYGSLMSTPILNAPQSGILGMHKIQERPVVVEGQVVVRPMMYLALSYDHRIVDGKEAVTFLVRVKESLEAPERLVLDL